MRSPLLCALLLWCLLVACAVAEEAAVAQSPANATETDDVAAAEATPEATPGDAAEADDDDFSITEDDEQPAEAAAEDEEVEVVEDYTSEDLGESEAAAADAAIDDAAKDTAAAAREEKAASAEEKPAEEANTAESTNKSEEKPPSEEKSDLPVQAGPLVDLLGPTLLSLEMVDASTAQFKEHLTNDALRGKKVIGLYFSADWCGPCRKFTPELVNFYKKMNARKGKKDQFEIVWISRCRDVNSFGQYFTQMGWMALPPSEAMGQRGQELGVKYKVKGIPSLVLLDDLGQVITTDARNKIPADMAGIGFPWRSPLATLYTTVVPRSLRFVIKSNIDAAKMKVIGSVKKQISKIRPKGKTQAA